MRCSDGQKIVMAVEYTGSNIDEVCELIMDYSIPSLVCVDTNDKDQQYLMTANPYGEAMEEYPEPGEFYVVDTETKEIWLYTEGEFNAKYKPVEV